MRKFDNFRSHLSVLGRAKEQNLDDEFVISGVIDKFRIQFELGWKVLKELLRYEGAGETGSPRGIIKAAYQSFDFLGEDVWLSMLKDRNDTAHIYDGAAARRLADRIIRDYIPEFKRMGVAVEEKYGPLLGTLP